MRNGLTDTVTEAYDPQLALVVYSSGNKHYIESHSINEKGQLTEGKPLLQETLQGIVDVFFDERKNMAQVKGLIPPNLLAYEQLPGGNYRMIWHRPAEIRVMHFAAPLKLSTAKVWVPAMVYAVERRSLSVYALRTNNRPEETTKLFRAPYHNVNDSGGVCLGNAKVKRPAMIYTAIMKYWEDLFWLSEFSHGNGSKKPVKSDLHVVWKKLLASKTKLKWSDINELVIYPKITLKSLLK